MYSQKVKLGKIGVEKSVSVWKSYVIIVMGNIMKIIFRIFILPHKYIYF